MLEYIRQEANMTKTENGAAAYESSGSCCLDLFATIGALRREDDEEIICRFIRAYTENPDMAMKLLFFARDVRGGLGERRVFRAIFNWLASNEPASVMKNMEYVPDYGRFDDLLSLMGTPCEKAMLALLKLGFEKDMAAMKQGGSVSLLAKWLPSVNTSKPETRAMGRKIARAFGLSDAEYRRSLSALRAKIRILENNLRERDYSFDYEKQPSRALFKYKKAFIRNDRERYCAFIDAVSSGEMRLHAGNVAPYELVEPYLGGYRYRHSFMRDITPEEKAALNATWSALPDYGGEENAIAVIDTSGSMYCDSNPLPAAVALSLGLYFAERNKGMFANCFIEFSARPQLIELKGESFADRLRYAASFNEIGNTNLEAVFMLILNAAVKNKAAQSELPAKIIIISDMEFDACVNNTSALIFRNVRKSYEVCGYKLPQVVFWNAASRHRQQPVRENEQGVALVSGVTPRLFSMLAGGIVSPYSLMLEVLESERYARIAA